MIVWYNDRDGLWYGKVQRDGENIYAFGKTEAEVISALGG